MTEDEPTILSVEARRKAGHYEVLGETYAKFEFFENGWNPYSRFLDTDKVDFILRRREANLPVYREVQVKYGKLYEVGPKWEQELFDYTSWSMFRENEFDAYLNHNDFFICLVLAANIGYRGDIFIFPVRDFVQVLRLAVPVSNGRRNVYISRSKDNSAKWFLRRQATKFSSLSTDTVLDVSHYRRNFGLLEAAL